jgi:myo-inositol-1-phosphate synthase
MDQLISMLGRWCNDDRQSATLLISISVCWEVCIDGGQKATVWTNDQYACEEV